MVIDHNKSGDASNAVKLGGLQELYKQGYKAPRPHDRATISVAALLAGLAAKGAGNPREQGMEPMSTSPAPQSRIKTVTRPIKIKAVFFWLISWRR